MALKGHMLCQKTYKIIKLHHLSVLPNVCSSLNNLRLSQVCCSLSRHLSHTPSIDIQHRHYSLLNAQRHSLTLLSLHSSRHGQKWIYFRLYSNDKPRSILSEKYTKHLIEDDSSKTDDETKKESSTLFGIDMKQWQTIGLIWVLMSFVFAGVSAVHLYGEPETDKNGQEIIDEFTEMHWVAAYWNRFLKVAKAKRKEIAEPSFEKLLPDPVKEPFYQPPYTLVLELSGILVHPDWAFTSGWRFKKRPNLEHFLQQIGYPRFEVVVYTKETGQNMYPVVDQLDKQGRIMFRLFRDSTRYEDGVHKKDIRCLNRDPSKVILIDCEPASVSLSPRNAILLDKWEGQDEDATLVDLANFLTVLLASGVDDVREVLDNYHDSGADVLTTFRQRQEAVRKQQEQVKDVPQAPSLLSRYSKGWRR